MFKTLIFLAAAAVVAFAADEDVVTRAVVHLDNGKVTGNITFTVQPDGKLRVTGRVIGMPAGEYGFHIHEKGDISNGCNNAGGHFNPNGHDHGHPDDEIRHVGDLGNIKFDSSEVADVDFTDSQIKLSGRHNIIGRTIILHQGTDDYGKTDHPDSKKTGNAGPRVVCGIIGIAESQPAKNAASTIAQTSIMILTMLAIII